MMIFFAVLFPLLLLKCESYRILGLNPYNGKSHFVMFEKFYKELARRGHEVDVLNHFPQKTKLPRYTDLNMEGSLPDVTGNFSFEEVQDMGLNGILGIIVGLCGIDVCKNAFNHPEVKALKNTDKKYDVIVTEIFGTDCMYGFAHHFDIPVVTLTTSVNLPWGNDRYGNPDDPSYIANYFLPTTSDIFYKFWNMVYYFYLRFYYKWNTESESDEYVKKFFGKNTPHLQILINKYSSFHLVNSHYSIHQARPWVPNMIEVGGLHIEDPQPLPEKLKAAVDLEEYYRGVVYVSFGSLFTFHTFSTDRLNVFLKTFSSLPQYKFLVKADATKMPSSISIPPNVYMEPWTPQLDVLCHPNVVLFVSHGGLMGAQEAVFCGVPILEMPIFADQLLNSRNLVSRGLALELSLVKLTQHDFLNTLKELLENPKYKENVKEIQFQFKDRPMSAMDAAIFWTEYVIRHNGAKQLRSFAANMSFIDYYYIDMLLIVLLPILLIKFKYWKKLSFKKKVLYILCTIIFGFIFFLS